MFTIKSSVSGLWVNSLGVVAIFICYFYVDRAAVSVFAALQMREYTFLHYLQSLPEALFVLLPIGLARVVWHWRRQTLDRLDVAVVLASLAVVLTNVAKILLKFVFARYWPDTFKDNNPSLLVDGVYGFNWFEWGVAYESFPSGHTATIVAFAVILAHFYPRYRTLAVALVVGVVIGLIALYYHFVSDVIAGVMLGYAISALLLAYYRNKADGKIHG